MARMTRQTVYNAPKPHILAQPDHYVAHGYMHKQAKKGELGLAKLIDGRYIVEAGTIYPANDATAIGVVMQDYDVTDGDENMAVIIHGFVLETKLPVAPSDLAKTALPMVKFVKKTVRV